MLSSGEMKEDTLKHSEKFLEHHSGSVCPSSVFLASTFSIISPVTKRTIGPFILCFPLKAHRKYPSKQENWIWWCWKSPFSGHHLGQDLLHCTFQLVNPRPVIEAVHPLQTHPLTWSLSSDVPKVQSFDEANYMVSVLRRDMPRRSGRHFLCFI